MSPRSYRAFVLAAALACPWGSGAAPAAPGWSAARSPHFVVVGDASAKDVRLVAHQFEQLRGLLQAVVKLRLDSARPLVVLALKNERSLAELLPRYKAAGRSLPAGLFLAGGDLHHVALRLDLRGSVGRYHVVYHEYLHSLNRLNFQRLPLWLDEGLAEFYATADIDEREARLGQILPQHVLSLRSSATSLLPLERLLAVDHASAEYTQAHRKGVFYAESAVLTHYLLMADGGAHRAELAEYLRLAQQGVPEGQAQARAFGGLKKLNQGFLAYLRGSRFPAMKVDVQLDPASIVSVQLGEAETLALQADFQLHTGQFALARERAQRALGLDAELALAHRVLGRVHAHLGHKLEALTELERAHALAPQDPVALYWLGVTRAVPEGDAGRARREAALRQLLELQPAYVPAQVALASLLLKSGRAEEALPHAQRACELEPHAAAWRVRLLSILRALGREAQAEVVERELVQVAHSDPEILTEVVYFYQDQDAPEEALALLARVRAAQTGQLSLLTTLGDLFDRLGRPGEAEATYRDALERGSDDPFLFNALGYLNAQRNVRVPEALSLIERALKRQPDNPAIRDSRGWALFRLGRLEESERDLRRALEGSPASAEILNHLAEVLAARGAQADARDTWRQALAQEDLSDERRASIEDKLAPREPRP